MTHYSALLVLADGTVFEGYSIGKEGCSAGELVFNTSMTGYQEILTDPSYARQMIMLTVPHVGNTGFNDEDNESTRVFASGLVIREPFIYESNYRQKEDVTSWLKKKGVVAIAGIDTRYLTHLLRDKGAMNACITTDVHGLEKAREKLQQCPNISGLDLAKEVTRKTIERWDMGRAEWGNPARPFKYHVVVYDFGVKQNILRILQEKGCHVTVVPAKTSAKEVMALSPDGIVLSNGPGDPAACEYAIEAARSFIGYNVPLLGICLGFQIIGLALGGRAIKMKFGHHGGNHPVLSEVTKRVMITSQNHGFSIEASSLPNDVLKTHFSLFDGTLQGIKHQTKPVLGFQGHPEAAPGPHDVEIIFDEFITLITEHSFAKAD